MGRKRNHLVNLGLLLALFISAGCVAPRGFSLEESLPKAAEVVPLPPEFQKADINSDNVIDQNESAQFAAEKASSRPPNAFWIIGAILGLSILACLCTPTPAALIKSKVSSASFYVADKARASASAINSKCSAAACWAKKKISKKP